MTALQGNQLSYQYFLQHTATPSNIGCKRCTTLLQNLERILSKLKQLVTYNRLNV